MNPAMLNKLKKMQKDMMEAQKQLESTIFTGTAGGGAVKIEALGNRTVTKVTIDPDFVDSPEDVEMLSDTILAAINDVMQKIDEETAETMGAFTGGMGGMGF